MRQFPTISSVFQLNFVYTSIRSICCTKLCVFLIDSSIRVCCNTCLDDFKMKINKTSKKQYAISMKN
ncbi:Replicase polyprotein 1a [Dirofilaria immitis]